jgi:hypothetical protein
VRVVCAGEWETGPRYLNGYDDADECGIPVRRLHLNWHKAPDPFRSLYENAETEREVGRLLDEFRPDLVHVTSCETLSASVLRAAKLRKLPLVLSLTDFWFLCPRLTLLRADDRNCDGKTSPWACVKCLAYDAKVYRWPSRLLPQAAVERLLMTIAGFPSLTRRHGLRGMVGNAAGRKPSSGPRSSGPTCV